MQGQSSRFLSFSKITLVAIYLVILAGAIVRSTGAGMGCPDWPKCFGKWVPPTHESQLPSNYHDIYKDRGYADTTFNVYHTWTEYVNRLMGALLGIFVFITFIFSLQYRKSNPLITYLCTAEVLLIGFQGWLGALVVTSNLAPVKITIHMVVALIIVALFIYIISYVKQNTTSNTAKAEAESFGNNTAKPGRFSASIQNNKKIKTVLILCLLFSIIQILIGTQVRERIDKISFSLDYENRNMWISYIGAYFEIHRIFAVVVISINFYLFRLMLKKEKKLSRYGILKVVEFPKGNETYLQLMPEEAVSENRKPELVWYKITLALIIAEILVGFILSYFSLPSFAQPLHLLLASIVFGVQFYLFTIVVDLKI